MTQQNPEILQQLENNYRITAEEAQDITSIVVALLNRFGIILQPQEYHNSQKNYGTQSEGRSIPNTAEDLRKLVEGMIPKPDIESTTDIKIKTDLEKMLGYLQEGKGAVIETNKGVITIRHRRWWLEDDRDQNAIPPYAISYIPIIKEPDYTEQASPTILSTHGQELEFQVVRKTDNGFAPVDIQELIKSLKSQGFPISIEGWISQGEFISIARKNQESIGDYKKRTVILISTLASALYEAGYYIAPTGVMITDGDGQANLGNPHVRNVMGNMIKNIWGENQEKPTPEELLEQFGVNGTHMTISIEGTRGPLYSAGELLRIYDNTHTPEVISLLALFCYSGEYQSKTRHGVRSQFPTARIAPVLSLLDEKTIQAFIDGRSPSLERAALNGMPHNPIGRQKQAGRIEFTVADSNYDILLTIDLENLLSYLTFAVQSAIRHGQSDNPILNKTSANAEDYENIMTEVQQNGFRSESLINAIRSLLDELESSLPKEHKENYQRLKARLLHRLNINIAFEESLYSGEFANLQYLDKDSVKIWAIQQMRQGVQQGLIIRALRRYSNENETEALSIFLEVYNEYIRSLPNQLEQNNLSLHEP